MMKKKMSMKKIIFEDEEHNDNINFDGVNWAK